MFPAVVQVGATATDAQLAHLIPSSGYAAPRLD